MKEEVLIILRHNIELRKKIADILGVTETTAYKYCFRTTMKLRDYFVVKAIMKETGLSEEDIFENPIQV